MPPVNAGGPAFARNLIFAPTFKNMKSTRPAILVEKKTPPPSSAAPTAFTRDNLLWMLGGGVVMLLGYVLMSGGGSTDPNVFNPAEVYSTTRITIAPILILLGLGIEIYAIFRTPKQP